MFGCGGLGVGRIDEKDGAEDMGLQFTRELRELVPYRLRVLTLTNAGVTKNVLLSGGGAIAMGNKSSGRHDFLCK